MTTAVIQLMERKYIPYSSIKDMELFKVTCEPSTCTVSSVMLKLKQPNIHNSNGDMYRLQLLCERGIV
jgi:hypothetical protein